MNMNMYILLFLFYYMLFHLMSNRLNMNSYNPHNRNVYMLFHLESLRSCNNNIGFLSIYILFHGMNIYHEVWYNYIRFLLHVHSYLVHSRVPYGMMLQDNFLHIALLLYIRYLVHMMVSRLHILHRY